MATNKITILRSQPTIYIGETGNPIQGFLLTVRLNDYNESHEVRVPNLEEATVKPVLQKLLADRDKLSALTL